MRLSTELGNRLQAANILAASPHISHKVLKFSAPLVYNVRRQLNSTHNRICVLTRVEGISEVNLLKFTEFGLFLKAPTSFLTALMWHLSRHVFVQERHVNVLMFLSIFPCTLLSFIRWLLVKVSGVFRPLYNQRTPNVKVVESSLSYSITNMTVGALKTKLNKNLLSFEKFLQ